MALFRNLSVNLRDSLFPPSRRDAQSLDFLDLSKNCSFLNRKLELVPIVADFHFWMGTRLKNANSDVKHNFVLTLLFCVLFHSHALNDIKSLLTIFVHFDMSSSIDRILGFLNKNGLYEA
jgi:hypothetical protein